MNTATYSPEDNKLRLYPSERLDAETYAKVKAAGFSWAPKQELFVAPMWTPAREDLLLELCGEIEDEDKTLVERAEARAERFDTYSENRAQDSQEAHDKAKAIASGIPFGQPILIGHHSEKHARKDAERIESGFRKASQMWSQSKYWADRAAGAIRAAKYKERPDVRARRIKGLEADKRKQEKTKKESELFLKLWSKAHDPEALKRKDGTPTAFKDRALYVAGVSHLYWSELNGDTLTPEEAQAKAVKMYEDFLPTCNRWIAHFENRLAYERAMLAESGGTVADRTGPEKGGACRCWATARGKNTYSKIVKVNKVSVTVLDNWGNGGADFTRTIPFDKLTAILTAADVEKARAEGRILAEDNMSITLADSEAVAS